MVAEESVSGLSSMVGGPVGGSASRFSMDVDNQLTQIQKLEMLEAETLANNQELQRIAEEMLATAAKGKMADAFGRHFEAILKVCRETNEKLGSTNATLRKGTNTMAGLDEESVAMFAVDLTNTMVDNALNSEASYGYFNSLVK
ncbi:hypothetical protein [Mycobacterium sp.]|uniref:hypothetical protein n=1 Tax=Mycobacterium sp. TaxID=1785 RepID=UPI003BA9AC2A